MESVSQNPLIATFQLSSAAFLNLDQSKNLSFGNELSLELQNESPSGFPEVNGDSSHIHVLRGFYQE